MQTRITSRSMSQRLQRPSRLVKRLTPSSFGVIAPSYDDGRDGVSLREHAKNNAIGFSTDDY
jgi:hypothetical protein